MLLHFISVMNFHLVQPLLHYSPNCVVNLVQMWTVGATGLVKRKWVCVIPKKTHFLESSVCRSMSCWKIKNSPELYVNFPLLSYKTKRYYEHVDIHTSTL